MPIVYKTIMKRYYTFSQRAREREKIMISREKEKGEISLLEPFTV
jgi:hypothetical protein